MEQLEIRKNHKNPVCEHTKNLDKCFWKHLVTVPWEIISITAILQQFSTTKITFISTVCTSQALISCEKDNTSVTSPLPQHVSIFFHKINITSPFDTKRKDALARGQILQLPYINFPEPDYQHTSSLYYI